MDELDYIETVCRAEKKRLSGAGIDGHLNGILGMLPSLRRKLTLLSTSMIEAHETLYHRCADPCECDACVTAREVSQWI